ncbi:MAG: DUF5060 domain-containing protein, partial [Planctomycetota bacterium]
CWLASALPAQVLPTLPPDTRTPGVWEPREFVIPTFASAPGGLSEASPSPHNPWLDYRLNALVISPSGRVLSVPGFYAADGRGGDRGATWKIRLTPDEPGLWGMLLRFEHGPRINARDLSVVGTQIFPGGFPLYFEVGAPDPKAPGFLAHGPLEYVSERYLRHADGTWFLKTGTNSPENLLGYVGFDGARDLGGLPRNENFLHAYPDHVADWRGGDPDWVADGRPNAGKGIIGALNYLASKGVNSVYFLPLNLGGDGQDTFPFLDPTGNSFDQVTHYDVGRLEQWDLVFGHAQRLGILLDVVLAEREAANIAWLGRGLTDERKVYLKTLAAMFGHHPGLRWILCEENAPEPNSQFTVVELGDIARWLKRWSQFDHPIAVHTDPNDVQIFQQILSGPADPSWLTSASLQVHRNYNPATDTVRGIFERAGRVATVDLDEVGPAGQGIDATNHEHFRKLVLWDVLLSGGNVSWYFGYHALPLGGDIRTEDFRTREGMFAYSYIARRALTRMQFWDMEAADDLVTGDTLDPSYGDAEVMAAPGDRYLIYFSNATNTGNLDLSAVPPGRRFSARWHDPHTGQDVGQTMTLVGGAVRALPTAPQPSGEDWVLFIRRAN